jgi:hypothetical protein
MGFWMRDELTRREPLVVATSGFRYRDTADGL